MAGQGVNLGYSDVQCLTRCLKEAAEQGQDLGSLHHLRTYERKRLQHVVPMMTAIDGLHRLFTASSVPVVLSRALGLQITDALAPVKVDGQRPFSSLSREMLTFSRLIQHDTVVSPRGI